MTLASDVETLQREVVRQGKLIEEQARLLAKQEEQINGERGISATLTAIFGEIKGIKKAMYWVAGLIITSSLGLAFGALKVVGG